MGDHETPVAGPEVPDPNDSACLVDQNPQKFGGDVLRQQAGQGELAFPSLREGWAGSGDRVSLDDDSLLVEIFPILNRFPGDKNRRKTLLANNPGLHKVLGHFPGTSGVVIGPSGLNDRPDDIAPKDANLMMILMI